LMENEVPGIVVAAAVLAAVAVVRPYPRLRTLVDEDLGTGPAEARRPGRPEVGLGTETEDLVRWEERERLCPDLVRLLIGVMDGRDELAAVDPDHLREQLPAPLDGFLLPVVADAEVPKHLPEGLVVAVPTDLLDVRRAEDLLHRDDPLGRRLLLAEEVGHERLHASAGEEHAGVVREDQRPAGHAGMALLLEEPYELLPDLRTLDGSSPFDPYSLRWLRLLRSWGPGTNGSARETRASLRPLFDFRAT